MFDRFYKSYKISNSREYDINMFQIADVLKAGET